MSNLSAALFVFVYYTDLFFIGLYNVFFLKFKLAGDKEDLDAKLRQMADELKKLKNKLGRQEKLEDEVCYLIHLNL